MECYEDVHSGAELRSVTDAVARFDRYPMEKIDQTEMWCVANNSTPRRLLGSSRANHGKGALNTPEATWILRNCLHSSYLGIKTRLVLKMLCFRDQPGSDINVINLGLTVS
eukprot:2660519-Pyramimonas_sp.AAC.1